ncbi:MAG: macro domain-containing protein [Desulfitobacteriaceae bacterium]|nr:macro domain-containing protein [Desulfitobacteriaceae bacterium]MDD4345411.1 macro domain-containing protein [Desulfitobacteriaceae bacterium]MDD4402954.1 macro domain-containing protein [Desulfitobacteriaceae bacterium]
MPFTIVRQDITKLKVDAIVNAANTDLQMGGGVCGAIFKAAGAPELQAACDKLAPIKTGEAVITPGFGLPAKFIIHAAGPVYRQWNKEQNEQHLRAAYTNSLKRAVENNCETIAFPLISSGIYGYPKDEALQVATSAIQGFLTDHDLDVTLVVFDKSAFTISCELLGAVESYIDEHYIETHEIRRRQLLNVERDALYEADEDVTNYNEPIFEEMLAPSVGAPVPLDDLVGNLDEPFSQMLLRLIEPNLIEVLPITTDNYEPAFIQFEAVSNKDYLNELSSTRGSNCTSVDALIYGLLNDGRKIIFPIEWKYVEAYYNDDKAAGDKGITRKRRYTELINNSAQLKSENHAIYYFEPFYQLMRQTLWAEQMVIHNNSEIISADKYLHIHVIPADNNELLTRIYKCSEKPMEDTWRSCINNQGKYLIVTPKQLLSKVQGKEYDKFLEYLNKRYW